MSISFEKKKIVWTALIGIGLIAVMVSVFIWGELISPGDAGVVYQAEKAVQAVVIALMAVVFLRLITLLFLDPISSKRKRPLPNIIKDIIGTVIFYIAAVIIVTKVYGESAAIIVTFLIGACTAIGFGAQDFVKDCIAGITMDIQQDVCIGDWVKLDNGLVGKIIRMKLTGVDLMLPDNTVLFVSNTYVTENPFINLSSPEPDFFTGISVVIDHSVPVDRARRILYAATSKAPMVFNNQALVVAESVQNNGVLYAVYFRIAKRDVWFETRHQVINSITKHLHSHGLRVCEISGEYKIRNVEQQTVFVDDMATSAEDTLRRSGLLEGCSESLQDHFSQRMNMVRFAAGEVIVNEGENGDTMFIIAEGAVEVSLKIVSETGDHISDNIVATLSDGAYFGEMSLLRGEKRSATVIAMTDVVLYEIERSTVKIFVEEYSEFARKLTLSILKRREKNDTTRKGVVQNENKEKVVSEFITAFKNFLWG